MKITRRTARAVLHVEIARELKDEAQALADSYGLSLSAFIRLLLASSVKEHNDATR